LGTRSEAKESMRSVATPTQKTCEEVAALLELELARTVKSIVVVGSQGLCLVLVRGDHIVNEVKLKKLPGLADYRMATESEIVEYFGCVPGFIGPVGMKKAAIIADRSVLTMSDFVCGANREGEHLCGVNFGRDLEEPQLVADVRNVVPGDPAPHGQGELQIARGIEVGHVFQLGQKYAEAMRAVVLDEQGKTQTMYMGCYGIGVSRIVAAAIEQNHDANGIIWPSGMAPFTVAVLPMNGHVNAEVAAAAEQLYKELCELGIECYLDDRGARPGVMFADQELIGIPHRVVIGDKGLKAGTFEYRARADSDNQAVPIEGFVDWLRARLH
jgi:prolyl-tRNA synthetase